MPGLFDRIKDTTTFSGLLTVGTSFVVDNNPAPIYQTFRNRYSINDANISVAITSQTSSNWMVCWCTYTNVDTLRVDEIIFTSNTSTPDAPVTFSGTSDVFVTASSRAVAGLREANTFTAGNYFTSANAGVIGIGNTSPHRKIDITGGGFSFTDSGGATGRAIHWGDRDTAIFPVLLYGIATAADTHLSVRIAPFGSTGSEKLRIDSTGNVGIGTTVPASKLVVSAAAYSTNQDAAYLVAGTTSYTGATTNWGTYGFAHKLKSTAGGVARVALDAITGSGLTEIFCADTSGNFGIGTPSPNRKLTVSAGGTDARISIIDSDTAESAATSIVEFYGSNARGGYAGINAGSLVLLSEAALANGISLSTNGAERVRIANTGNVGIGTSSPGERLSVATGASEFAIEWAGPGKSWVLGSAAGRAYIRNKTDNVEAISIQNDGRVGIGTTSPSSQSQLHVVSATNFQPQIIADHVAGAGTGAAYFVLDRARGTPSAKTAVVSGDPLGTVISRGYDGAALQNSAWLAWEVDGAVSPGNVPGGISVYVTPQGASSRLSTHFDASGNVGIGTLTPSSKLSVEESGVRLDISPFGGATGYVGTQSNHPLGIITNNAEVIRLTTNGNVGIGTTGPTNFGAGYKTLELTGTTGGGVFRSASSTVLTDMYSESAIGLGVIRTVGAYGLRIATNSIERMHITSTGEVGIGTSNPVGYDAKLAVFNGNIAMTATNSRLYLYYASATNHAYLSAAAGGEILFSNGTATPSEKLRIDTLGRVGIGGVPSSRLDVSSTGSQLGGTAKSATFATNSGSLGTTATNELAVGSLGFVTVGGNSIMLGVRGYRFANGNDWTTTSICLGMDVDNTVRAGGNLWLGHNGNVGISEPLPLARFHIKAIDNSNAFLSSGLTRGIRMQHSSVASVLEGVDQTGAGSYQPLFIGGSYVGFTSGTATQTERMRLHASGGVSIGDTTDPGANTTSINSALRVLRRDTANEGGELQFCRANDNAVAWYIDVFGAGSGTDPGSLRWVDDRAATPASRLELNSRGQLTIVNDLGPASTDTQAVGFRGSPNNDRTGTTNYNLVLSDAGKTIFKADNSAQTITIPTDGAVGGSGTFPIGTCIMIDNTNAGGTTFTTATVVTVGRGASVALYRGDASASWSVNQNRTIARGNVATIRKVRANTWVITGTGLSA